MDNHKKYGKIFEAPYYNTCAIRMSEALNHTNYKIPKSKKSILYVEPGDEKRSLYYAIRVVELRNYIERILFGPPEIVEEGKRSSITGKRFEGEKGIIFFDGRWAGSSAQGHIDLWDGKKCKVAGNLYFVDSTKVELWVSIWIPIFEGWNSSSGVIPPRHMPTK